MLDLVPMSAFIIYPLYVAIYLPNVKLGSYNLLDDRD
jgi:hypothetical protein